MNLTPEKQAWIKPSRRHVGAVGAGTEKDIDPWLRKFDELDKANIGVIDFDETIADLEMEQRKRMEEMQKLEDAQKAKNQSSHAHDILGNLQFGLFSHEHTRADNDQSSERHSEYTSDGGDTGDSGEETAKRTRMTCEDSASATPRTPCTHLTNTTSTSATVREWPLVVVMEESSASWPRG